MSKKVSRKKHAAKVKFQVVLETLTNENKLIDVARQYGISPNLITKWRKEFFERGSQIFEQGTSEQEAERKINNLQLIIGKKEVEIELLKNFLGNLDSR
jgi:transposase-like protein